MTRKTGVVFVFATLTLDAMGLGIVIPVLPDVIKRFIPDPSSVARHYGIFIGLYALMQFVSSPFLGRLSDRFGRRPILLVSLFGAAVDYLIMAYAPTLALVYIGRMLSGVCGASYTAASAYMADLSDDSDRAKNFGLIGAGFGVGFVLGPIVGGMLGNTHAQYPFIAAAALNALNFVFGLFFAPETLPLEKRRAFDWKSLNPFRALVVLRGFPRLYPMIAVYSLTMFSGQTHPSVWNLYTRFRFNWGPREVGLSLAAVGVMSALTQGALTGVAVKWFGERRLLLTSVFGLAAGFFCFGAAPTEFYFYVSLFLTSLFWTGLPLVQSQISKDVPAQEQGELQGSLMAVMCLCSILNPIVMSNLFSFVTREGMPIAFSGAPYFLGSLIYLIAWWILVRMKKE